MKTSSKQTWLVNRWKKVIDVEWLVNAYPWKRRQSWKGLGPGIARRIGPVYSVIKGISCVGKVVVECQLKGSGLVFACKESKSAKVRVGESK